MDKNKCDGKASKWLEPSAEAESGTLANHTPLQPHIFGSHNLRCSVLGPVYYAPYKLGLNEILWA